MNLKKLFFAALLPIAGIALPALAQNQTIGSWRSHLPYNRVVSIATDGTTIYAAGQQSFYTYDIVSKQVNTYSKVEGMSDVGLTYVATDIPTGTTILGYVNSNIDLFRDEAFYNVPYIKLKNVTGDKKIYNIYTPQNGYAYLSTGLGVVVLNFDKREIKETYTFTAGDQVLAVKGFTLNNDSFYAATSKGLFRTHRSNPNLQSAATWQKLDSARGFLYIASSNGKVFVSDNDSMFVVNGDALQFVYKSNKQTKHLDSIKGGIAISQLNPAVGGKIYTFNASDFSITDSTSSDNPAQVMQTADNALWIADINRGLKSKDTYILPEGPNYYGTYDILAENNTIYVAHGAYDDKWNIALNSNGISIYDKGKWTAYNTFNFPPFYDMYDAMALAKDPVDNTLYVASLMKGLYYKKTDNTGGVYREGVFEHNRVDPTTYRVSGVTFDMYNNMWVTNNDPELHELLVKYREDGNWYKFHVPIDRPTPWQYGAARVIVDDYNQKWFFSPLGGGVIVYNDNYTIPNASDDSYRQLVAGKGAGNLPDNNVNCIVNDKKGTIWIGTTNGIGIVNCPDQVIGGQCETEIRVVQYDQFPGFLFSGENVKTIAVDGANRKWVGTNNGVWLISEDALKIVSRFTVDNSPLPSNLIQVIKIDPVTGDVYIGTDQGMVSYRGTATDGGKSNSNVKVYPNPVTSGYAGTIAIKGLVENADVRITDISGQLVFRTVALGGQAIWNGLDYKGRRPQSGVYLIFASDKAGNETFAGKMVFIK